MEDQDIQQTNTGFDSINSAEVVTIKEAKESSSPMAAKPNNSTNPNESLPSVEPEPELIVANEASKDNSPA